MAEGRFPRWTSQLRLGSTVVAALVAGLAGNAAAQSSFTLGSAAADVRRAQGVPTVIERLSSLGVEIWTFGAASVRLSSDSLRVIGWEDVARTLRTAIRPGPNATSAPTFGAGSHQDDVVRLMGTPTGVREDRARGTMLWRYGASAVTIGVADRRVIAWVNAGRNLHVHASGLARVPTSSSNGAAPGGAVTSASAPRKPNAPVTLDATIAFREPSGNGALDGGENATVSVELRNRGPGTAFDVGVHVAADTSGASVTVADAPRLVRLDAGATARVTIPISVAADTRDGRASLLITVTEANGFGIDAPRRLTIPVRAAWAPRLALSGVRADDQSHDGRISAREFVEVTARVWNEGPGTARDVQASLGTGDDTFLVEEGARQLTLGTMGPGEHRDLSFVFYTNSRARDVRIVIALTEATARFGATLTLPFAVDRPITQTLDVAVADPAPNDGLASAPPALLDEVERDLPRAVAPNPDAIAVVIGVERYASLPAARFAAGDARLFGRYAAAAFGVSDDRNHLYVRTDADATGNEFRKLFGDDGWLARRVRPTTDLYVYFSGHGAPDVKTRAPYLLPTDADAAYPRETGYALTQLYQQLARLDVRTVTVFLDACFTGATRSSGTLFAGARSIVISVEHPALLRDNFAVIAAAGGDQIASDYPEKRHGLFTYYALLGLRGAADADADRAVTVAELERYLANTVPGAAASLDREQTPVVIARDRTRVLVRLRASQ
jgi:hypothetical protein